MPYQKSNKLPGETASKLGHLSITKDPFIKDLLSSFEARENPSPQERGVEISNIELDSVSPSNFILAFDGSISTIPNSLAEYKKMSYINVATICLDLDEMRRANKPIVDPFFVKDLLNKNADTINALLPLSGFFIKGKTMTETIREALFAQFKHVLEGGILETLKFLIYREWDPSYTQVEHFKCIHTACNEDVPLQKGKIQFNCPKCKRELTIVDYLGLLSEVNDESNSDSVAMSLMNLLEHLTLFYYLRNIPEFTSSPVLLIKDGPLMLRGQYSRLIESMRSYVKHQLSKNKNISLVGVEKTGAFVEHIPLLKDCMKKNGDIFIPTNEYILKYIKQSPKMDTLYGERVLYGAKVFYKIEHGSIYTLNIPTGEYKKNPTKNDLLNYQQIFATLPEIVSSQFENSLAPIAAANRIASMSIYPSNSILEKFTKDSIR